jgi:hypothetical protein
MRTFLILVLCLLPLTAALAQDQPDGPTDPDNPVLDGSTMSVDDLYLQYQRQDGVISEGVLSGLSGTYLEGLTWEGNEDQSEQLLLDLVKSIRVRGYTMVKKVRGNLGIVFYFPHLYDIELKDGSTIIGAQGRVGDLESFTLFNTRGKEKVYTYFIRYWLEDKAMFNDNQSPNYEETPVVPDEVAIFVRFSKPAS